MLKNPIWYLLIAKAMRGDGFTPFLKAIAQSEMCKAFGLPIPFSYDDNRYARRDSDKNY